MTRQEIETIIQEAADAFAVPVRTVTTNSHLSEVIAARKFAALRFQERGLRQAQIARLLAVHHSTIAGYLGRRKGCQIQEAA